MNSLQSDFSKYLTTADSSLLQTNTLLQLMGKSQEVETKLILWKIEKHSDHIQGNYEIG